jgi:hypothetical protein
MVGGGPAPHASKRKEIQTKSANVSRNLSQTQTSPIPPRRNGNEVVTGQVVHRFRSVTPPNPSLAACQRGALFPFLVLPASARHFQPSISSPTTSEAPRRTRSETSGTGGGGTRAPRRTARHGEVPRLLGRGRRRADGGAPAFAFADDTLDHGEAALRELRPPVREAGLRQPPREHLARPGSLLRCSFLPSSPPCLKPMDTMILAYHVAPPSYPSVRMRRRNRRMMHSLARFAVNLARMFCLEFGGAWLCNVGSLFSCPHALLDSRVPADAVYSLHAVTLIA